MNEQVYLNDVLCGCLSCRDLYSFEMCSNGRALWGFACWYCMYTAMWWDLTSGGFHLVHCVTGMCYGCRRRVRCVVYEPRKIRIFIWLSDFVPFVVVLVSLYLLCLMRYACMLQKQKLIPGWASLAIRWDIESMKPSAGLVNILLSRRLRIRRKTISIFYHLWSKLFLLPNHSSVLCLQ